MPATPQITLTATLEDLTGEPAGSTANPSKLLISLVNFGLNLPQIAGTSTIAKVGPVAFLSTGEELSIQLWGNDQISPAGTYYSIAVVDGEENIVQEGAYQFIGTQTINLSNASQMATPPPAPVPLPPGNTYVFSVVPTGAIDGTNATFTFPDVPTPATSFQFYKNGSRMQDGIAGRLSGSSWTYNTDYIPQPGDTHIAGLYLKFTVLAPCGGSTTTSYELVFDVIPAGVIDGTNAVFTLPSTPTPPESLQWFKNGQRMTDGIGGTLTGNTWTYSADYVPQPGDTHIAGLYQQPGPPSGGGGGSSVSPATDTTYGTVLLAMGQTSPVLSTVATTGSYTDLNNKPTIPPAPAVVTGLRYGNGSSPDTAATSSQVQTVIGGGIYDAAGAAAAAQTAAQAFAANASNISSGTLAAARVPALLATSGTINGVTIGATTPAAGTFTTINAQAGITITDANPVLTLANTAGAAGTESAYFGTYPTLTQFAFNRVVATGAIPNPTIPGSYINIGYVPGGPAQVSFHVSPAAGSSQIFPTALIISGLNNGTVTTAANSLDDGSGNMAVAGTLKVGGKTLVFNMDGTVTWT